MADTNKTYTKEIAGDNPRHIIKVNLHRGAEDSYTLELWEGVNKLTSDFRFWEIGKNDPNYSKVIALGKTYRFGRAYVTKGKALEIESAMDVLAKESPKTQQQIEYENLKPGLDKIKKAIYEQDKWQSDFNHAMDSEDGASVFRPAPKNVIEEAKKAYPKAAAYYKAEQYSFASHYAKSSAGRKAMERILNGEDYNKVIEDMDNEWHKSAEEAVWNN